MCWKVLNYLKLYEVVVGEVGEMVEEEICDGGDGGGSGDSDDYEG